jgi:mannose-6-phosphate isomerase-like protein (cupin superfamily)
MRRIVTGYDAEDRPGIIFDGEPPMVMDFGSIITTELWVTGSTPPDLKSTEDASLREWEIDPPSRGTAFRMVRIMPVAGEEKGAPAADEPEFLGEHATDTLDYVVVLSGEVTMTIGGREETLRAGDSVVQRATPHDWVNRGSEPCILAGVLVSTRP